MTVLPVLSASLTPVVLKTFFGKESLVLLGSCHKTETLPNCHVLLVVRILLTGIHENVS